ncbi:MAG: hormogonium polysaccharide secretion pseudopilin HpsB [Nostoc sp. DedVER02]|uniref:hormogonium polysaccharide secretion pseudopilin HpsB n=1 Tax=unclassified Nostoc TaxID=2593658 RepID=UPI002AD485CA|nr:MULTISPECIES: hormogonium polysaccharide secretion pseudopilin HpsB [unclassified Nostoc]MDZ7988392.1 hormogonium polysaccharide secretion pseudopilin HpsB [Nostoc sp. DedVER02]MDZ8112130.1 hormogonium polysaccharide secretion pseudopilin HpsB [Nostoc sp. DedVER01b]
MIKRKQQIPSSGESGFTIIESLVAIVIVAILLTAIAPVIVISTATRVQSRRVELATQVAKTFIDGIRTGAITAPSTAALTLAAPTSAAPRRISDIAGTPAIPATGSTPAVAAVAAITGRPQDYLITSTNMPAPTSSTKATLYCFNNGSIVNPDCSSNTGNSFYIQAGRIVQTTGVNDGYRMGIRIYRGDVDFSKTLKASTDTTKNTQKSFTGGLGDRQAPLIEMTTDIGNSTTTFQALCQRLGTATNQTCQ